MKNAKWVRTVALLAAVLLLSCIPVGCARADDEPYGPPPVTSTSTSEEVFEGGVRYRRASENAWAVCGYDAEALPATATIAETIQGEDVRFIWPRAFENCTMLAEVVIPAGISDIGSRTFRGCTGLRRVTFAEGSRLERVGAEAFKNCTALTDITLPASLLAISAEAFAGCRNLTSLSIPEQVESIGEGAFRYCGKLEDITFARTDGWVMTLNGAAPYEKDFRVSESADVRNPADNAHSLTFARASYQWIRP